MDRSPPPSPLSGRRSWRWFKRIYAAATLAVLAWALFAAWPSLRHWDVATLLPGALAAMAGWLVMVFLLGCGWAGALDAWSGLRLRLVEWLPMQISAWIGRYLPGKLGLLAGKMQVCERGVGWKRVTGSVLSEQAAFVGSGLALSALALPYWLPLMPAGAAWHPTAWLLALMAPALVLAGLGAWASGRQLPDADAAWSLRLLGWSTLAHMAAGAGFHLLLASLIADPPGLMASIGLLAAAHTAGVLAIFAPAGLGVRELVIAAALAPVLGWPQATAITALQRALVVVADAGMAAAAVAISRCARR